MEVQSGILARLSIRIPCKLRTCLSGFGAAPLLLPAAFAIRIPVA
jgi:hypothetical protein